MSDLSGIDLNLLISLDALIEEANVTRAAARLNVSQPALSAQLARLRHIFGDPLLVPSETGRGMIATTRALALKHPLNAMLRDLEALVKRSAAFEPLTANRAFTIAANDNAIVMMGLDLIDRIQRAAGPGNPYRVPRPGPGPNDGPARTRRRRYSDWNRQEHSCRHESIEAVHGSISHGATPRPPAWRGPA